MSDEARFEGEVERETEGVTVELPLALQSEVAHVLQVSRAHLKFQRARSEEAEVWCVRRLTESLPCGWVKRHLHRGKAQREAEAIAEWGGSLGAPQVISRLNTRSLFLAHCAGSQLQDLAPSLKAQCAEHMGARLAGLHLTPYIDSDPLPLSEALSTRASALLTRRDRVTQRLESSTHSSPRLLLSAHRAWGVLTERSRLTGPLEGLREGGSIYERVRRRLALRVPCHRDLSSEHLLFTVNAQPNASPHITLQALDWGQSRADHWASDWAKLYAGWRSSSQLWEQAWSSYWMHLIRDIEPMISSTSLREVSGQCAQIFLEELQGALAFLALGSLAWATNHMTPSILDADSAQDAQRERANARSITLTVWRRGQRELKAFMDLSANNI